MDFGFISDLTYGSPPNDTILMSCATHRTGHWIVHGTSFGVCVSDRLASIVPDTSRTSCRKRTLKQEEPAVCRGPGVNDGPTQQLVRSFQNEVVEIYTVQEGQGSYQRERERQQQHQQ